MIGLLFKGKGLIAPGGNGLQAVRQKCASILIQDLDGSLFFPILVLVQILHASAVRIHVDRGKVA